MCLREGTFSPFAETNWKLQMNFVKSTLRQKALRVGRGLAVDQIEIKAFLGHQIRVHTHLSHVSLVNHNDLVRVPNGGEAVRYDNACAAFLGIVQRLLDDLREGHSKT